MVSSPALGSHMPTAIKILLNKIHSKVYLWRQVLAALWILRLPNGYSPPLIITSCDGVLTGQTDSSWHWNEQVKSFLKLGGAALHHRDDICGRMRRGRSGADADRPKNSNCHGSGKTQSKLLHATDLWDITLINRECQTLAKVWQCQFVPKGRFWRLLLALKKSSYIVVPHHSAWLGKYFKRPMKICSIGSQGTGDNNNSRKLVRRGVTAPPLAS